MTIPTLALTAFALTCAFLLLALLDSSDDTHQVPTGATTQLP